MTIFNEREYLEDQAEYQANAVKAVLSGPIHKLHVYLERSSLLRNNGDNDYVRMSMCEVYVGTSRHPYGNICKIERKLKKWNCLVRFKQFKRPFAQIRTVKVVRLHGRGPFIDAHPPDKALAFKNETEARSYYAAFSSAAA